MNDLADLERGYRRVLMCYPKAFRQESEQEILGVLLATAREGQRRIGLAESAALIRGGLRMRLRLTARPPRDRARRGPADVPGRAGRGWRPWSRWR